MALLRAGHHLVTTESEDELLHSILNDAVSVLDAQRGAIVLADAPDGGLRLRALASGKGEAPGRFHFSKKLAQRCFSRGESILCCSVEDDAELKGAVSIADGAMASVLCVLAAHAAQTPRRAAPRSQLLAKSLHRRRPALGRCVGRPRFRRHRVRSLLRRQRDLFLNTITILAQAVELRDEYTGGHTARVTNYSLLLAQKLNLPAKDIDLIRIGTPLHDIGKIGIDDEILRKPGKLTEAEYEIMKTHTVKGAAIISTIPDLHPIIPIVRSHHERWDGQGYPDKLVGRGHPQLARIVAVADAFDAMTSNRPYHAGQERPPAGSRLRGSPPDGRQTIRPRMRRGLFRNREGSHRDDDLEPADDFLASAMIV